MSTAPIGSPMTDVPTIAFPALDDTLGAMAVGTYRILLTLAQSVRGQYATAIHIYLPLLPIGCRAYESPGYYLHVGDVFHHHRRVRRESKLFRILETMHTIAPMHTCYYYMVSNYASLSALQDSVWSLDILLVLASITSLFVDGFFVLRVSLIGTKARIIAFIAVLCLLTSNVSATDAFRIKTFISFGTHDKDIIVSSLFHSAFANYLLAGAIIVALFRRQAQPSRNSNWPSTHASCSTLQWLAAVTFLCYPQSLYWYACAIVALRLRAITLLSILNSRNSMLNRGITVFYSHNYERDAIVRARRLAIAEQFNVPRSA
ncbi:hypothetical protein GY45DRAFT_1339081 [Cubamyces sp. BRFM 1775]|nr:hypothetical protein GY45DRAFT_1339081 [Cubamyces sp. BRFM 1775]